MSIQFVLSAPVSSRILLCIVMLAVAVACFFYGARCMAGCDEEDAGTTGQRVTASYSKRTANVSWRDQMMARAGWCLFGVAFALRGAGSLLFAHGTHLPKSFFAFVLVAAPAFVAAGLFLLLSPQNVSEKPPVKENECANEYSMPQAAEEETEKQLSLSDSLRRSLPANVLAHLVERARTFALTAFDALLLGSSMAAWSWWLWTAPLNGTSPGAPRETMGSAHGLAMVLWFSCVAWIALNQPFLECARLQTGRFQSSFQRFVDAKSADAKSKESARNEAARNQAARNEAEAQERWKQSVLQPIWLALLCGALFFGWASVRADSSVELATGETLLLLCGSLGFAAAAWLTFVFDADLQPMVSQKASAQVPQAVPQAREEASLSGFVLHFFLRSFARSEAKRHNALSSTRTQTRKQRKKAREDLENASLSVSEVVASQSASQSASQEVAASSLATGAAQKDPQVRLAVFQVARNFLTLFVPCVAAAVGTWHTAPWQIKASSAGVTGAAPEIWISELLVSLACFRYLLMSVHQDLHVARISQRLRITIESLREEVTWRTQQLTTLHSVSADLNNTLNNEQVLNIALQRLMEAVRADAGAVWLVADFDQVASEKINETRSFDSWNAELRRHKNLGGSSAASSTRTSSTTRLNLADACDSVQASSSTHSSARNLAANSATANDATANDATANGATANDATANDATANDATANDATANDATANDATGAATRAAHRESAPDAVPDKAGRGGLFSGLRLSDTSSANGTANGTSAREVALNGGEQKHKSSRKASQEQAKEKLNELEALLETGEGNGFYIGGPVESWKTKVSGNGEANVGGEVDGDGVLHRVSHTRDTYGSRHGKTRHHEQNQADAGAFSRTNAAPENAAPENATPGNAASKDGLWSGSAFTHRNWRLVRAAGYDTPATTRTLAAMSRALEEGGIARCARLAASWFGTIGDVHLAPIRWNGEVIGVLSVTSRQRGFGGADRRLLEALAIEVSGALRNAYMYQQARRWAERDGVTNLFNHRAMQEKLGQEMLRAHQTGTELTVVMMDLDNFKFFNDTYGHPVGDGVLVTVAQCLRDCCRNSDILGRYGGDEFIVLLPDSSVEDALQICRCIETRLEQESYGEGGEEERRIPIGLSFGAAVYPHDGRTPLEILTVADANLYDAKRGGSPLAQVNKNEDILETRHLKENGVGGSFGVLDALVTAIDNKDHYTRRHSEDVTHWAILMGRELGFSEETLRTVRISGLLHDVGKIAVPDAILRKPGRLSDDEFAILQQHPVFGALIVKDVPNLPEVLGGIRHHHERFDGKGYPDKLTGAEIPMLGRLLAVPDCFSAMTTNRPYRKALEWSEALAEIERGNGTQFDPQMAEAFLQVIARLLAEQNKPAPLPSFNGNGARNAVYETVDYPSAYAS